MKEDNIPNPNLIFPIKNLDSITYVKPSVKNPNIIVGDFTYFADKDFEKHVTHHYEVVPQFCFYLKNGFTKTSCMDGDDYCFIRNKCVN